MKKLLAFVFVFKAFFAHAQSFTEREIFMEATGGDTLYGVLQIPDDTTLAAVLMLPGSGTVDRDGNSAAGANLMFRYLADDLTYKNIATLRVDKRFAGKSQNIQLPVDSMTFEVLINDAQLWLERLRVEVGEYVPITVLGHSQGALVALASNREENPHRVVHLCGAGSRLSDVLRNQLSKQLKGELYDMASAKLDSMDEGHRVSDKSLILKAIFNSSTQKFLLSWNAYDPCDEINRVEAPVLLVHGARDLQVPNSDFERMDLCAGEHVKREVFEQMNHVLRNVSPKMGDNFSSYRKADLPLAEGLSERIATFILSGE